MDADFSTLTARHFHSAVVLFENVPLLVLYHLANNLPNHLLQKLQKLLVSFVLPLLVRKFPTASFCTICVSQTLKVPFGEFLAQRDTLIHITTQMPHQQHRQQRPVKGLIKVKHANDCGKVFVRLLDNALRLVSCGGWFSCWILRLN